MSEPCPKSEYHNLHTDDYLQIKEDIKNLQTKMKKNSTTYKEDKYKNHERLIDTIMTEKLLPDSFVFDLVICFLTSFIFVTIYMYLHEYYDWPLIQF